MGRDDRITFTEEFKHVPSFKTVYRKTILQVDQDCSIKTLEETYYKPEKTLSHCVSPSGNISIAYFADPDKSAFLLVKAYDKTSFIDLSSVCGPLRITNKPFSGFSFSTDETHFAFIAEASQKTVKSFWSKEKDVLKGTQYDLKDHYGEQMADIISPIPFLLNIQSKHIYPITLPSGIKSASDIQFLHNTLQLIFVGYPSTHQNLGHIYYTSRPSHLFSFNCETQSLFRSNESNVISPSISPSNLIVYLSSESHPYHNSCLSLWTVVPPASPQRVVPIQLDNSPDFTGLWHPLVQKPWLTPTHIAISSALRSTAVIYIINVTDGTRKRLPLPPQYRSSHMSMTLYDCDLITHSILFSVSNFSIPFQLWKVSVNTTVFTSTDDLTYTLLHSSPVIEHISFSVIPFITSPPQHEAEVILVRPSAPHESSRWILWPHGGPHSITLVYFSYVFAFLIDRGYSLALVNYRGSSGYGQNFLESLPGHIGEFDVEDCKSAIDAVIHSHPDHSMDITNVSVCGGSHGGFLVACLITKFPTLFKSAISRNPVTNIAFNHGVSDIPDWCMVESGLKHKGDSPVSVEDFTVMYSKSPVVSAHKVKTPLLTLLGDRDRRVPMGQGIQFHRLVESRGIPCRCVIYPENQHSLTDSVETEADMWMNVLQWLRQF